MWSSIRLYLFLLAIASLCWGTIVFPTFRRATPAEAVVQGIIAGDRFQRGTLAEALERVKDESGYSIENPENLRASALIQARISEDAMQRNSDEEPDRKVALAQDALRKSLSRNPGDAFIWLMLYSAATVRDGFAATNLRYLDQSYSLAPLEGGIALRRNRLALAVFSHLSRQTQDGVVSEFSTLVDARLIDEAAMNIVAVQPFLRGRLLSGLEGVDQASKEALRKKLTEAGVNDSIPGVQSRDRPWQ